MEVGQGQNWGRSAGGKKIFQGWREGVFHYLILKHPQGYLAKHPIDQFKLSVKFFCLVYIEDRSFKVSILERYFEVNMKDEEEVTKCNGIIWGLERMQNPLSSWVDSCSFLSSFQTSFFQSRSFIPILFPFSGWSRMVRLNQFIYSCVPSPGGSPFPIVPSSLHSPPPLPTPWASEQLNARPRLVNTPLVGSSSRNGRNLKQFATTVAALFSALRALWQ
jgi:hypothetical protein